MMDACKTCGVLISRKNMDRHLLVHSERSISCHICHVMSYLVKRLKRLTVNFAHPIFSQNAHYKNMLKEYMKKSGIMAMVMQEGLAKECARK